MGSPFQPTKLQGNIENLPFGGEEKLWKVEPFKVVKEEGDVLTFEHKGKTEDPGVFRFAYRLYPINANLPHRQDFAYVRWI